MNEAANHLPTDRGAMAPGTLIDALIDDLVDANRILHHQGVVDAFGHVSVRDPRDPQRFLLSRSLAPALVSAADIVVHAVDGGDPVDAPAPKPYLERFIHSEIYRARPEVGAIVHSHSPSVLPFGLVAGARLRPLCHMAGFLGSGAAHFEIRDSAGDGSDLLVRTPALGNALACALGAHAVVLMRGHGSTVVAPGLRVAVYRAVYTELNARLALQAATLGEAQPLSAAEAAATAATNEAQVDRPWALWREAARRALAPDGPAALDAAAVARSSPSRPDNPT